MQAERRKKQVYLFFYPEAQLILDRRSKYASREEKKASLLVFLSRGAAYLGPKVKVCKPRGEKSKFTCFFIPRRSLSWTEGQSMQAERRKKQVYLFFYPEAQLILDRRSKYASREEKKASLLVFLSRGAAYLGPKVKVFKPRGEKSKFTCFFLPRRSLSYQKIMQLYFYLSFFCQYVKHNDNRNLNGIGYEVAVP